MKLVWLRALLPPRLFAYSAKSLRKDSSCSDEAQQMSDHRCLDMRSSLRVHVKIEQGNKPETQSPDHKKFSPPFSIHQKDKAHSPNKNGRLSLIPVLRCTAHAQIQRSPFASKRRCLEREGTDLGINQRGAELADNNGEFLNGACLGGIPCGGEPPEGLIKHGPQIAAVHPCLPALHRGCARVYGTVSLGVTKACTWYALATD